MIGILFSIIAGIFVSLQNVFNTRASGKIGLWETNTIVHGTGFIVCLIMLILFGKGDLHKIKEVNKVYLLGGVCGAVIVYSIMKGISLIGTAYAISLLLVTQLILSFIIDTYGLFGARQIDFNFYKVIGIIIMIGGILVYKLK